MTIVCVAMILLLLLDSTSRAKGFHDVPERVVPFIEWLQRITPPLILAVVGGLVKLLRDSCKITLGRVVVSTITAGFAGVEVFLLIQDLGLPSYLQAGLVGISGFAAGEILDTLSNSVIKFTSLYSKKILGSSVEEEPTAKERNASKGG